MKVRVLAAVILAALIGYLDATSCYQCTDSISDPGSCTNEKFDSSKSATVNCAGSCFKSWTNVNDKVTVSARGCNPLAGCGAYPDGCKAGICIYCCDPKDNDKCNGGGLVHASVLLTVTMIALIVAVFG